MKVAVVTDVGFPDIRVEKEILTLIKKGYSVYVVGPYSGKWSLLDVFIDKPDIMMYSTGRWSKLAKFKAPFLYNKLKKNIDEKLEEIKPDVVLAIDIYSAIIVHELGYPMVFDDHELFSEKMIAYSFSNPLKNMFKSLIRRFFYIKYEELLASNHPIITVSKTQKEFYIEKYNVSPVKVYVVKNYPMKAEGNLINNMDRGSITSNRIKLVYIGKDLTSPEYHRRHRTLYYTRRVLLKLYEKYKGKFEVVIIGGEKQGYPPVSSWYKYIKHTSIYKYLSKTHVGIASHDPCFYHKYASPNKIYTYALAGVIPVVTDTFKEVIEDFNNAPLYVVSSTNNFEKQLYETYEYIITSDPEEIIKHKEKIREYTMDNLTWEKYEENLIEAIKHAS